MATASGVIGLPGARPAWRPNAAGWVVRLGVLAALFGFVLWSILGTSGLWAQRISLAIIYAIIGLSLNVVLGYTGQVSLGHHAFVGLSAFVSAYTITERNQTFWFGLLVAIVVGGLSAGLLGLVALRIKGLYLALITLTYGFVAVNSLFEVPALTRGGAGMPAPRPAGFGSDNAFALLCLLCLAATLFVDWRLLRTKVGRAILSVKHSEPVAASYAINLIFYKVFAFVLSGAFAGLAGALFAARNEIVVATDFQFTVALLWVLMVVVGGLGSRIGVVIGSAFFALFPHLVTLSGTVEHFIEETLGRNADEMSLVVGPALALLTMIQFPGGIAEQISPITRWLGGQKFTMHPEGHKPKEHHGGRVLERLGLRRRDGATSEESDDAQPARSDELQVTATVDAEADEEEHTIRLESKESSR
ncbi:MAG: branched-chain amino acid ABC transporter permease [Actinomycetota bacterium]